MHGRVVHGLFDIGITVKRSFSKDLLCLGKYHLGRVYIYGRKMVKYEKHFVVGVE